MPKASAVAQSQRSRQMTANSYFERGNDWFAKRELDKAIADFDLAIATASEFAGLIGIAASPGV
ncbi:MAG TPA: hypothetical protein VFZ34_13970 [Blastocatellia bacterium]|nr:hypothetical protein [Blastocatellia bacterium]